MGDGQADVEEGEEKEGEVDPRRGAVELGGRARVKPHHRQQWGFDAEKGREVDGDGNQGAR